MSKKRKPHELHVPPLDLRRFHWDAKERLLTAEESDLRDGPRQPNSSNPRLPWFIHGFFNDAADVGIAIKSHHTGEEQRFYLVGEDRNGDEVAGWRFAPVDQGSRVKEVLIIND